VTKIPASLDVSKVDHDGALVWSPGSEPREASAVLDDLDLMFLFSGVDGETAQRIVDSAEADAA
jgi:hypothetical protein